MLCSKCGSREATIKLQGRELCHGCARSEVVGQIRKNVGESRLLNYKGSLLTIELDFLEGCTGAVIEVLQKFRKIDIEIDVERVSLDSFSELDQVIYDIVFRTKQLAGNRTKVVLPFTADFLLLYLIEVSSMEEHNMVQFGNLRVDTKGLVFVQPLFNLTSYEVSLVRECRVKIQNQYLSTVYQWITENLLENREMFRTFQRSFSLFSSTSYCSLCGGVSEGEICRACMSRLTNFGQNPSLKELVHKHT